MLAEELLELLARAEPARQRRHADRGVLGEQGDDALDVVALPGVDVGLDDLLELVVAERAQRLLLALLGHALLDRGSRAAAARC